MRFRLSLLKLYDDRDPKEVREYFAASPREALAKKHILELEIAMRLRHRPEDRHIVDVQRVASA